MRGSLRDGGGDGRERNREGESERERDGGEISKGMLFKLTFPFSISFVVAAAEAAGPAKSLRANSQLQLKGSVQGKLLITYQTSGSIFTIAPLHCILLLLLLRPLWA